MARDRNERSSLFKLIQFKFYSFLSSRFGMALCIIGAFVSFNTIFQLITVYGNFSNANAGYSMLQSNNDIMHRNWQNNVGGKSYQDLLCAEPIDIVYTWVNGSDPRLIKSVSDLKRSLRDPNMLECTEKQNPERDRCYRDDNTASRYVDNQELKYSLRSIEKNAPWIRHIYIVTNGQVPSWLDLSNPKVSIVTHQEIFANKSHLPTFSSPSIEAHLHRIPGLSKKFLYLNDDVMFGREIYPDDFVTQNGGQKVFLSWPVPNCNDGCPNNWIGDGFCDQACNVSTCEFDAGDCNNSTGQMKTRWWNRPNANNGQPSTPNPNTNQHGLNTGTTDRLKNYCSRGCPDSWVGDKHCDRMCKNEDCGFDAGDCGVEIMFASMRGYPISANTSVIDLPDKTSSVYFNLSSLIGEGTITDGSHDNALLVRTATISQKHKIMTLTFHKDKPKQNVSISITFEKLVIKKDSEQNNQEIKESIEKVFNITLSTKEKSDSSSSSSSSLSTTASTEDSGIPLTTTTPISKEVAPTPLETRDIEDTIKDPLNGSKNDFTSSLPTPNLNDDDDDKNIGTGTSGTTGNRNNNNNNNNNNNDDDINDSSLTLAEQYLIQEQNKHLNNLNSNGETVRRNNHNNNNNNNKNHINNNDLDDNTFNSDLFKPDDTLQEKFDKLVDYINEYNAKNGINNQNQYKKNDRELLNIHSIEIDNSDTDLENEIISKVQFKNENKKEEGEQQQQQQQQQQDDNNESIIEESMEEIIERAKNNINEESEEVIEDLNIKINNNNINNYKKSKEQLINEKKLKELEIKIKSIEKDSKNIGKHKNYLNFLKLQRDKLIELINYNKELTNEQEEEKKYLINKESEKQIKQEGEVYPWEEFDVKEEVAQQELSENSETGIKGQRKLKDMFADSLKFVNRLYTKEFGSSPRKVPAHMPHMIDIDIMNEIQAKWPSQWEATSSHSLRHPQDMQYAFSFFYYMIHKKIAVDLDKLWYTEWDGNRDGYLNDNELRTLSVNVYGVPIKAQQWKEIKDHFYQICMEYNLLKRFQAGDQDASLKMHKNHTLTPWEEREDCKITLDIIKSDNKTIDDIKKAYSKKNFYKTTIDGTDEVAFLMIDNNDTIAQSKLDGVRQKRHKFICLNDNINHTNPNTKNVVKVLHDFYDSLFPLPSSFELPPGQYNKYLYIEDFRLESSKTKSKNYSNYYILIIVSIILLYILLKCKASKSFHKSKISTFKSPKSKSQFLSIDSNRSTFV